ncbi:MAG: hypothetical protein OEV28_03045 [Nitrospirota bacterium]|nr:hypothetical protein [Nitrospirota bacterium]
MRGFTRVFLVAIGLVLLAAAGSAAFDNEPDGFRGVKWGAELSSLSGFRKVLGAGDTVFYAREGEKESIGDASVASIRYLFYKGQLRQAWIMAEGAGNFAALQSALFKAFGKPIRVDSHDGSSEWIGARTTIMLSAVQPSEKEKMDVMLIFTDTGFLGTGTKERAEGGEILKDF